MASAELIHICVCTFTVSNMIDCECVSVCTPKHMQTTSISPCTHRLPGRNWSWSPEGTSGRSACISPNKSQRNVRSSRKNEATASQGILCGNTSECSTIRFSKSTSVLLSVQLSSHLFRRFLGQNNNILKNLQHKYSRGFVCVYGGPNLSKKTKKTTSNINKYLTKTPLINFAVSCNSIFNLYTKFFFKCIYLFSLYSQCIIYPFALIFFPIPGLKPFVIFEHLETNKYLLSPTKTIKI